MEKGDVTRFGVSREDVSENHIGPESFLAIFAGYGHLVNCGEDKSKVTDRVIGRMYPTGDLHTRLIKDILKAQRGERIYCPGARELLFPDEQKYGVKPRAVQGNLDFA